MINELLNLWVLEMDSLNIHPFTPESYEDKKVLLRHFNFLKNVKDLFL